MPVAQRRDAVGALTLDALLGADAEVQVVDEPYDDREYALLTQALARDVLVRLAAQARELFAEALYLFVLAPRALGDEGRVVDALHAPHLVDAYRLQGAAQIGRAHV